MKRDLDKIGKFELEISKKYGQEAVKNPNSEWSSDKESDFQKEQKALLEKELEYEQREKKIETDGFYISEKLLHRESKNESCPVCDRFVTKIRDEVYLLKHDCCHTCYVKYAEGREDRWKSGWRPSK